MNGPRKLLVIAAFTFLIAGFSSATDIYIAQNAAGGNTGADCADAHAVTWFNTSSNWGSGSSQIGPGTTVHLCGTFTAPAGSSGYLSFRGSGTSGSPITLLFESGAVLTAPYWGSGAAINTNGHSYVTIDGGSNGTIQASANGTGLANQQDGEAVQAEGGSNVTIQNLTIANIYVHTNSLSDEAGQGSYGIDIWNGSNLSVINNTIHDVKWAVRISYAVGSTFSNMTFQGNTIYNIDHGLFITDSSAGGAAIMSGFYVYGNTVHDFANWDDNADNNHHDGFHLNTNSTTTQFTDFYLYNNYVYGDPGIRGNAGFYSYPASTSAESNIYAFNNVFVNNSAGHCWANGPVGLAGVGSSMVLNNTFVSNASSCKDNGLIYELGGTGVTSYNNIHQNLANAAVYSTSGTTISAIDYNNYYQSSSWFYATWYSTLPSWESAVSGDTHSNTGNSKLTSSYHLTDNTSAAWQSAKNLNSICNGQPNPGLGALCSDKAGVARQQSGSWDMGAYEDSANNAPVPPTGLVATVQ